MALCKRCLASEPADRPADAGEVAQAVAALRAAADERARQAELERVQAEGEQATAAARAAERRKRRRLVIGAAAVLAVGGGRRAGGGAGGAAAGQRRPGRQERRAGREQAKVEARFELAQKAIAMFHTGVSEDALLKNDQFKELRTKLLKEAAGFYAELEKLLAGQTDAKSRKALAEGYFQLAELTGKIGDPKRSAGRAPQGLAVRRELAAEPGADVETRLDVARSLGMVGVLLEETGDQTAAMANYKEQCKPACHSKQVLRSVRSTSNFSNPTTT